MEHPEPFSLWTQAVGSPHRAALVIGGRLWTWGEMAEIVDRAAAGLHTAGVEEGRRVGLWAAPTFETIALIWALGRVGAAPVPFDPRLPDREVRRRVGLSGCDHFLATLRTPEGARQIEPDHVLASGATLSQERTPGPEGLGAIVFTSGSTGEARGVILTESNIRAAVAASRERLGNDATDRWLLTLPLFHVGGLSILWRSAAVGGTIVVHDRFDPQAVAAAVHRNEITIASLVPTMLRRVLDVDGGPFPRTRAILLGGAPAAGALVERGLAAGLPILATYGMTETCAQIATVVPGEEGASLGTVGPPLPGVGVELRDVHGRVVANGVEGEITVAGPTVSPGYVSEEPRSGVLHTGDRGRFDPAGRLIVTGRADDMILTGGENVQPAPIERQLERHPGVATAVVYGIPDEVWGNIVAAAVVATGRRPTGEELAAYLAARLPPYQVPRRWRFLDELPTLSNGKVDRRRLAADG